MGLLDMWREARGAMMRKEYEDAMTRMRNANSSARSAFLASIDTRIEDVVNLYGLASKSERKVLLKQARQSALAMWNSGDWPSALGLSIACLNAESRYVPGEDAAYVSRETGRLIQEAEDAAGISS